MQANGLVLVLLGEASACRHEISSAGNQRQSRPSVYKIGYGPHTFYDQDPSYAPEYLRRWCYGAKRSRLQPIKDFVTLVERHWDGVIAWHATRVSNGLLEGTNSLIQAAKARARGYRTKNKMITIAYLIAGKLPLPTVTNARPA